MNYLIVMSESEDLEPVLLIQARNNRVQQNWGNKGDASRVRLIQVKKGTYNGRPASLVVLHFHLAVKIMKQADFTIRILPVPSATGTPTIGSRRICPEEPMLMVLDSLAPVELSAGVITEAPPPANDPAVHFTLPAAPAELSTAVITKAPLPGNNPAVHFALPPAPAQLSTAVAAKALPPANTPGIHFALPPGRDIARIVGGPAAWASAVLSKTRSKMHLSLSDIAYHGATGEDRRKESPHVQLVAFGPRNVRGPNRDVPQDLDHEEQKLPEVAAEHVKFKFWKKKEKAAEHHPNSLGGTIDVCDEQSWIRLSAIKSELKKGGCPQRFTFAFVVRHSRPIRLLVRPSADIKRLATWKEPVMTCLEKYTQADYPKTCTRRDDQGAALCDRHCAEFNHSHMTTESWKKLLVMDDLQKWDWEENNKDGVSLCLRDVHADSTRRG